MRLRLTASCGYRTFSLLRWSAVVIASTLTACMSSLPTTNLADLKSPYPGYPPGYLPIHSVIDGLALLPPPPAPGSAQQSADDAVFRASRRWVNTLRWQLAELDAELMPSAFACSIGIPVGTEATPHLNMLLRRTIMDSGMGIYKVKQFYKRTRPFMAADDAICTPKYAEVLRKDGSYASGHAAVGWAWALVLAEVVPERADAVVRRGYEFAQSRVVCGVHWQSDVDAGHLVASAVVAQLHANSDFVAQLGAARAEVAARRTCRRSKAEC